ncbi:MAG TPA: hypothetical protein VGR62_17010 [Candidatus Binatia bacterium]|nr:hypothetical protein [Candidatus Binatia bacterium]
MVFLKRCVLAAGVTLTLGGCVMQSTYNSMLAQQQAIEASLQSEIAADQVKIQQLENGIRVTMSEDLLYPSGGVELSRQGRAALWCPPRFRTAHAANFSRYSFGVR